MLPFWPCINGCDICRTALCNNWHAQQLFYIPPNWQRESVSVGWLTKFSSRWYLCTWKSLNLICVPPALRTFPNVAFKMFPDWWWPSLTQLTGHKTSSYLPNFLTLSLSQGRSCSTSSFHISLPQEIESVISLAVCPHVVTQTQHLRSSQMQASCEGCFSCQAICLVISLHSGMSMALHPQEFSGVDVEYDMCQSGLPIPLVASLLSMWRGWHTMWSDCYLVGQNQSSGGHNVTASIHLH